MKKIVCLICLLAAVLACTNNDIEFDDFEFQTVYFPYQTPLRSLMLGDEVIGDNSIDLEHAFSVGASMGGAYENTKDRELTVALAPELAANITDGSGNTLEILPSSYYDATFDKIVIPKGSFFGKMRVNLTDAFFNDPMSTGLHYVLPVRITGATAIDSILQGSPATGVDFPDPRVSSDWEVSPKDYVLFGIKYVNPTHGVYLYRGKRTNVADANDVQSYTEKFLDDNINVSLNTESLSASSTSRIGGTFSTSSNSKYTMQLTFDESTNGVTVSQKDATTVVVNGTGSYYSKDDSEAESYNGKKHRTIYLDYTFEDDGKTYQVNDSLVFVDTNMKFEEFSVNVND